MKNLIFFCFLVGQLTLLKAQNMGVKLPASTLPNTTLDVNGSVAFREGTALVVGNGANHNVSLASSEYSLFRITAPTAAYSITGFTNGQNGRFLTLINATGQLMTLTNLATSSAGNQINTGGTDLTLGANGVATLVYNSSLTQWVVTGGQGFLSSDWSLLGNSGTTAGTNFVGTTNAQDLVLKANNTEGVRVTTAGNTVVAKHMAVGPNSAIDNGSLIQGGFTFKNMISAQEEVTGNQTTNFTEGVLSHLSINATNNPTTEFYALDNIAEVKLGNIQNYPAVIGAYGGGNHRGTGTVTKLYGTASYAQNKAGGTVSDLQGMNSYIRNMGAGTVTNSYGFFTKGMCNTGTGTVTNSYGLFVDAACNTGGGTVTNDYGVFIEDHSTISTTHYNLYSKGGNSKNYFAGNVGIGLSATSPIDALHIDKGTSASANLKFTAGTTTGQTATDGFQTGIDGTGNAIINQMETLPMIFKTDNVEQMRIAASGNVGIGVTSPNTRLDMDGGLSIRPSTTVNLTADGQAVTVGNASFLVLSSNNATATSRTFTLSNGLQNGQILVILLTLNSAELVDSGNCALASTFAMSVNDTITLIWNGSSWYETARSVN
jgi:hypothetical protein